MARSAHSPFLVQARAIVAGLQQPQPAIYWADFLLSLVVGYGSAAIYLHSPAFSAQQLLSFPIAVVVLYRLGSFMHEIVHFRGREMKRFRITWDLLVGIPMLTPSFFYQSHRDHHNARHYGTEHDGEYLPLGRGPWSDVLSFMMQVFVQPILVLVRFLLAPLTFLHPRLRQWTLQHASSFVIDYRYRRSIPNQAPRAAWAAMDLACSLRAWMIFVAMAIGITNWTRLPQLYLLATCVLGLNYLRTLAAHRYLSSGQTMSHEEQLFDSTNITGLPIVAECIAPLGMRYHALHHLFPSIPYHNLGIAHRRLLAELPLDSPYRDTVYPHWFAVIGELIRQLAAHRTAYATVPGPIANHSDHASY